MSRVLIQRVTKWQTALVSTDALSSPRVRAHNLGLILRSVRDHGTIHRARLAADLGLTRTSVTRLVGDLVEAGVLVNEAAQPTAGRGRPATPVRFNGDTWALLGMEARVDHTEVILTTLEGEPLASEVFGFDLPVAPDDFVARLVDVGSRLVDAEARKLLAIGLAIPARFNVGFETVARSDRFGWGEVDLIRRLRAGFGWPVPIAMRDISRAAALANARQPEMVRHKRILHFQLGMGLGMALTAGVELDESLPPVWGAIEHAPLGDEDVVCPCGRRGCVDASIGFARFRELTASVAQGSVIGPTGIADHMSHVAEARQCGDPTVAHAIQRLTRLLAHVLGTVSCIVVPDAITLGGYPLLLGDEFIESLKAQLSEELARPPLLLQSPLGDRAPLAGTVMLALDAYVGAL